jgi:hypothetical protein
MNKKFVFMVFSIVCFAVIGVCLIINVSISRVITWAFYPIISILFGWAITITAILKERGKLIYSLLVSNILLLPYLFILEKITGVNGWFINLGLPLAVTVMITMWAFYFIYTKLKLNIMFMTAILVFLIGVVFNIIVTLFSLNFANVEYNIFPEFISVFVCLIISIIYFIFGMLKRKK